MIRLRLTQSEETHSGYGLAGQEMKIGKAKFSGPLEKLSGIPAAYGGTRSSRNDGPTLRNLSKSPDTKDNYHVKEWLNSTKRQCKLI